MSERGSAPLHPEALGPEALGPEALGREILAPGSAELLSLVERRPARMLVEVAIDYALIAASFALVVTRPAIWSFLLAFVVIGNCQYALTILTHEGNHAMLFKGRSLNDVFCRWVLCAPFGVDLEGERHNHLTHHRLLATPADPDRYLYRLADKNTKARLLLFFTGFTSLPHVLEKSRKKKPASVLREEPGFFSRGRRPTLIAQIVIAIILTRFVSPYAYIALWLGPLYVMAFVPHKIRMFCEHAQIVLPDEAGDARRLLTFRPNPLEKRLIAPIGLSYHAEHHMFPGVPYYALPRVARHVEGHPAVEVRRSYLGFLLDCLRKVPLSPAT
ncbi:MAG: fatty acid desaturase [Byssovorax sp.]